jgi:serine/threonine-protein kinase
MIRRFRAERQILARLVHPDIASILDGGITEDGRPWLVLQYVDGIPITDYCERHNLDLEARLRLFRRVADAVQFAHGRLVVHRDLKPSNILVTADGSPRLLDFGIAKPLGPNAESDDAFTETRPGLFLLTPEHASPEQLRAEPVGTATDVWALGVLLYQLLTGRRPFPASGRSPAELQRAIAEEPPPPPSAVAPRRADARRLRGDLDRIVLMALRKEPERRYASAGQFAEDLERWLAGLPVRAQRDTLRYRAGKFITRNRGFVVAAGAFMLLLSSASVLLAVQSRRAARERDNAQTERASAEAVVGMVTRLFESSNPGLTPGGDTLRVAAFLEQAERQVDSLSGQPELQARMWRVLGNMHLNRGRYDRARDLLERSWRARTALHGEDDLQAALTYHEMARAVNQYQGPGAARPLFEQSVERIRRLEGERHPDAMQALQDLTSTVLDPAQRDSMIGQLVRDRTAIVTDSVSLAATLNTQGSQAWANGDVLAASGYFEQALHILEGRLPPDHPARLSVTGNLAATLRDLGQVERAEELQRFVLDATLRSSHGEAGEGSANWREMLALSYAERGQLERAEAMLDTSLAAFRKVLAPRHWRVANTLRNLGLVMAFAGHPEAGLATLDSAIALGSDLPTDTAYKSGQRTIILLQLGRNEEALRNAVHADSTLRALDHKGSEPGVWLAAALLENGNAGRAAELFRAAVAAARQKAPAGQPKIAQAECGLGIALAELDQRAEARTLLATPCDAYRRNGTAYPSLLRRIDGARERAGR